MVTIPDAALEALNANPAAAMITVGGDGIPKAVRVGLAEVDGKLWSSGTEGRVRTARLRADPRCTLYVQHPGYGFSTLETTVKILDGADAAVLNLRLFRQMQRRPEGPLSWFGGQLEEGAFLERMVAEGRVIYEFDVFNAYGM